MGALSALWEVIARVPTELRSLATASLLFGRANTALLVFVTLVGLTLAALIVRTIASRPAGTGRIVVPAILNGRRRALGPAIRHTPLVLFAIGVPLFMVALADPFTAVVEQQVSYPGRRIAVLIDASSSMLKPFAPGRLNAKAPNEAAFFTSIGAAEAFIRQRRGGKYRDLIALIEFGDEAYVITPFTTDYDNVLLSASLIGDWSEFMRFPNQGTKIAAAIEEGTNLFKAFNFVHASGNLMIIFSDGEDTQVTINGRPLTEILGAAVSTKIPVYLIRTNRDKQLGDIVPDSLWKGAVETTGGRFYAAANEGDVLRAIDDIDRLSPGKIEMKQYTVGQPQFAPFAIAAIALWCLALALRMTLRTFAKFP